MSTFILPEKKICEQNSGSINNISNIKPLLCVIQYQDMF